MLKFFEIFEFFCTFYDLLFYFWIFQDFKLKKNWFFFIFFLYFFWFFSKALRLLLNTNNTQPCGLKQIRGGSPVDSRHTACWLQHWYSHTPPCDYANFVVCLCKFCESIQITLGILQEEFELFNELISDNGVCRAAIGSAKYK